MNKSKHICDKPNIINEAVIVKLAHFKHILILKIYMLFGLIERIVVVNW